MQKNRSKNFKKTAFCVLCTAVAVSLFFYLCGGFISGFYSDTAQIVNTVYTGSVNPVIENLLLETNGVEKTEEELKQSSSFLRVNQSNLFSFTVRNAGGSGIAYSLELQIAWLGAAAEAGKLLVYHYDIGDGAIYRNLQNGDFSGAVIGADVSDKKEIVLSAGAGAEGISEIIDSQILGPSGSPENKDFLSGRSGNPHLKDYKFKLFFYEDPQVSLTPAAFHNQSIQVNLIVRAVLSGKQAGWSFTETKSFRLVSVIDTVYPVIREVSKPKTYFITQAQGIDLAAYAVAEDIFDGDITDKLSIHSSPEFNPQKAGTYTVTYTVFNSLGNPAAPLQITVVIWDFIKITSGYYHTLALTSHGKVYTWGYNYYGQLGDGTYTDQSVPKQLQTLDHIIDVAAGVGCSYALASDGQVYSWGRNENGRLGDNTTSGKNSPVKVAQPAGVKFTQISARFATAGGVTAEGDVYSWGYGGYGAAGTGKTSDNHAPVKIDLFNIAQVEFGYYNGAAVSKDGKVYTWGSNTYGQLGTGAASSPGPNPIAQVAYFDDENIRISQVSAGYYHMAAVSDDGRLFTWGYGYEGRLGNGSTSNKYVPQPVPMPDTVTKALAGYFHTGALTSDGSAYFFGQNTYGKHGTGNSTNHLTPVKLESVGNVSDFSLAYDSSFVLSGSTDVYGMGYGGTGVLGTGNNSSSNVAVKWAFVPPELY